MIVNIQSVNFKADQKLVDHVNNRIEKLKQFHDHVIGADVFLKLNNHNGKENKSVEMKIAIPGSDILVSKDADSFEEAADTAADVVKRQLKKNKEKVRGV